MQRGRAIIERNVIQNSGCAGICVLDDVHTLPHMRNNVVRLRKAKIPLMQRCLQVKNCATWALQYEGAQKLDPPFAEHNKQENNDRLNDPLYLQGLEASFSGH